MNLNNDDKLRLGTTARKIVENGKGILALDETSKSLEKRFALRNVTNTFENRVKFRDIILSTKNLGKYLGGVIMNEEMLNERSELQNKSFVEILQEQAISIGIKLDKGLIEFRDNEKVSVGLEDLEKRVKNSKFKTAEFAKWRSVFKVDEVLPSFDCIEENCVVLARYARICQENKLVPIVEPEILWEGEYTLKRAQQVTNNVLSSLISHLNIQGVYIPGIIIKLGYVTPGRSNTQVYSYQDIGISTFTSLISTVPVGISGVVFLSGGHNFNDSMEFLNAINKQKGKRTWNLSYSYGRAFSDNVLDVWNNKDENIEKAQEKLINLLEIASQAIQGKLE
ncbi:fructose-bisphosphate aldolase [Hamiltosporidium magnivora]|uniref:fructose-bisphosphate aldolase n=1 Tax=Hamiltosporidium magnivora TaxID=148818 RepID=A0A4Q9LN95_9MICR|nr:fructose-bisphosphate aldolase [Hamiltosporidium magnivora]